ncbi:hypothetical protein C8R45DRAFT_1072601 [Mycena sanguinolenta]|nr:hypothetical protein C8R45DRAFT_1072601 [Mycena sanguinolenta]
MLFPLTLSLVWIRIFLCDLNFRLSAAPVRGKKRCVFEPDRSRLDSHSQPRTNESWAPAFFPPLKPSLERGLQSAEESSTGEVLVRSRQQARSLRPSCSEKMSGRRSAKETIAGTKQKQNESESSINGTATRYEENGSQFEA